jgi:hypothetical protein
MTLEQQLEKLAQLGLTLNPGITIDDILYSFNREAFETKPFSHILFQLGIEVERAPWGRPFCSRVWNFDTECIYSTGSYVTIMKKLCEISGDPDYLKDLNDFVDLEKGEAWLSYTVHGRAQRWTVDVEDDWADMLTINYIMHDLERDGKRFYYIDNGQAMLLFFLDQKTAAALNELSDRKLQLVLAA